MRRGEWIFKPDNGLNGHTPMTMETSTDTGRVHAVLLMGRTLLAFGRTVIFMRLVPRRTQTTDSREHAAGLFRILSKMGRGSPIPASSLISRWERSRVACLAIRRKSVCDGRTIE